MGRIRTVGWVSLALVAAVPANARAQDGNANSGCRASAARVTTTQPALTVEPVRANANTSPCSSQSAAVLAPATVGPISASAVGAFTNRAPDGGVGAIASAAKATVVLGSLTLAADEVEATAAAGCDGSLTGSSRVVNLTINGNLIALPPNNATVTIPLGPLGTIVLNEEVREATRITRRAVRATTPAGEIVLAEAIAGPGACASDTAPGPAPVSGVAGAGPNPCPNGATYDPSRNLCVIRESNGNVIVVGRPFEGPSGGTVFSLPEARKRSKSPCLRGGGPKFAVLGTKGNDRITGSNRSDRIVLLAGRDHSEGGRGDDCIDGGRGRDTMSGALGNDRILGGSGRDALIGGSHVDRLHGGSGNDTINSGFGRDRVFGGKGSDRINAATAGPPSRKLRCGKGRDKIRVNRNERKRVRGCERVYMIR